MQLCSVYSIGGATGYRLSEVSGLTEGSTLIVGGKEVEVSTHTHTQDNHHNVPLLVSYVFRVFPWLQILGEISADQWNSGRCFTGASSVTTTVSGTCKLVPVHVHACYNVWIDSQCRLV